MFVYQIGPIDFWETWNTERQAIGQWVDGIIRNEYGKHHLITYLKFRDAALNLAKNKLQWEGDHGGIYFSALPLPYDDNDCTFLIAWKQSNGGTTFVASPLRLKWLENEGLGNKNWVCESAW